MYYWHCELKMEQVINRFYCGVTPLHIAEELIRHHIAAQTLKLSRSSR